MQPEHGTLASSWPMSLRFRNRIIRAGGMYEDEIQPRCCEAATAVALEEPDMVRHLLALLPTEAVAGPDTVGAAA